MPTLFTIDQKALALALSSAGRYMKYIKEAFYEHRFSSIIIAIFFMYCAFLTYVTSTTFLLVYIPDLVIGIFFSAITIFGTISAIYYFGKMLLRIRPKSPIKYLLLKTADFCAAERKFSHFVFTLFLFSIFATIFSINKSLIYQVNGFKWDNTFLTIDRIIFSTLPHSAFTWIFSVPTLAFFIELAYQMWFWVYYFTIAMVGYYLAFTRISQVYLLASILTWFVGGNIIAVIFSSAGPIFFDIHGISDYTEHYDKMSAAVPFFGSFTVSVKEGLMEAFELLHMSSISAFPSMHVASTMLILLLCREVGGKIYLFATLFFMLIFIGSFILLWHYFVDSIAGVFIGIGSWCIASSLIRQDETYTTATKT